MRFVDISSKDIKEIMTVRNPAKEGPIFLTDVSWYAEKLGDHMVSIDSNISNSNMIYWKSIFSKAANNI